MTAEYVAEPERHVIPAMPQPPDGARVIVGKLGEQTVYQRDDEAANGADACWYDVAERNPHPLTWVEVQDLAAPDLPTVLFEPADVACELLELIADLHRNAWQGKETTPLWTDRRWHAAAVWTCEALADRVVASFGLEALDWDAFRDAATPTREPSGVGW